jgi:hypothetical protein
VNSPFREEIVRENNPFHTTPPPHVWDNLDSLLSSARTHGMRGLAAALEEYEEERKRQNRAIENLESQLKQLADGLQTAHATYQKLVRILEDSGMDPQVMLASDEVFAEPEPQMPKLDATKITTAISGIPVASITPTGIAYCIHGNDMTSTCSRCRRK